MQPHGSEAEFKSLTLSLDGWFDQPFEALPPALQVWVAEVFRTGTLPWNEYVEAQRRSITLQHDQARDPALKEKGAAFWDFINETDKVRKQIEALEAAPADTADAVVRKAERLAELRDVLARREFRENLPWPPYEPKPASDIADERPVVWLSYPQAMRKLADAHGASPEELAGWIWDDSLMAHLHANELGASEQFTYATDFVGEVSMDYVALMSACWFKQSDIEAFEPKCRYITGGALLERWREQPYFQGEKHICSLVEAGRLNDAHPIAGATQASFPDELHYPPLIEALFEMEAVDRVEVEDFGGGATKTFRPIESGSCYPQIPRRLVHVYFQVKQDADENKKWWDLRLSNPDDYGLLPSRGALVGKHKNAGYQWKADEIAKWLAARYLHPTKDGMSVAQLRRALNSISGYDGCAEAIFPAE